METLYLFMRFGLPKVSTYYCFYVTKKIPWWQNKFSYATLLELSGREQIFNWLLIPILGFLRPPLFALDLIPSISILFCWQARRCYALSETYFWMAEECLKEPLSPLSTYGCEAWALAILIIYGNLSVAHLCLLLPRKTCPSPSKEHWGRCRGQCLHCLSFWYIK